MKATKTKVEKSKKHSLRAYKKKILSVSGWSEEDVKVFEENKKLFNQWQPPAW